MLGSTVSSDDYDVQIQRGVSDAGSKPLLYRPIDSQRREIRILQLLPGSEDDPIRGTLHTILLTETSDYEALSYNWGDPQVCRAIEVDGMEKDVTENLFNALRRLRLTKKERCLWVDAICINQDDDTEKSHQVNLMSKIYSWTARALLWLGDFSGSKDAYAWPNVLSEETARLAFDLVEVLADDKHFIPVDDGDDDIPTSEQFEALDDLVRLPKDAVIICGGLELSFVRFAKAHENLSHHDYSGCCHVGHQLFGFWKTFYGLGEIRRNLNRHMMASEIITMFKDRMSSDPRERIYAYLGLIGGVPADYSLHLEEAFKQTTRAFINNSGSLEILLRVSEAGRSLTLPTWVPDWTTTCKQASFFTEIHWLHACTQFEAGGKTRAETRDPSSNAFLDLQGCTVDRAVDIGPVLETIVDKREMIAIWQSNPNNVYPQGGTYLDAAWHAITMDIHYSFAKYRRLKNDEDLQVVATEAFARDGEGLSLVSHGYRGFTTKKGNIGVGHPDMEAGDSISILKGGNMPFILRPIRRDGGDIAYQHWTSLPLQDDGWRDDQRVYRMGLDNPSLEEAKRIISFHARCQRVGP